MNCIISERDRKEKVGTQLHEENFPAYSLCCCLHSSLKTDICILLTKVLFMLFFILICMYVCIINECMLECIFLWST